MKFSAAWLQQFLNKKIDVKQLVKQLTSAGLEVDEVASVAPDFNHVVVAEIVDVSQHPDAEKLKICQVNVGQEKPITIVTNVATVQPGMKVPAAMIGAVLPGNFKIAKTKLRGVESFGMFCGVETLGLGEAAEGLLALPSDAPVGTDLRDYLSLNDQTIEVELTPNRSDCLSILGIAREAAVANNCHVKPIKIKEITVNSKEKISVSIREPKACPRYLARVITGINAQATTPIWMVEALRRSGVRSIHPVVDVTNYVMLELGQPMHAFDKSKLEGDIEVRFAKKHEKLVLLNNQDVELTVNTLLIADDKKPLAIAGIMGGLASSVMDNTQDIVLESAFFDPITLMGKARHYGLHTDSSHRFERGVDPELPRLAMERATELLLDIVGGEAGPIVEQLSAADLPKRATIKLRRNRIELLLGCTLKDNEIDSIFKALGMEVESNPEGWKVTPPSYRFDISIEVDLIEELARIYGYDNIPVGTPKANIQIQAAQPDYRFANILQARDYQEAITYSFTSPKILSLLTPENEGLALDNPISSELSAMRTTLWAGLLQAAQYNINRQQHRVRLFETGLRFIQKKNSLEQIPSLAGLVLGSVLPEQWGDKSSSVDFYDLKVDVEALLALTGQTYEFQPVQHPALHPGRSAKIIWQEKEIGWLGALHPKVQQALDLPATYLFELNVKDLEALMKQPEYQAISKFPAVRRDIAIIVSEEVLVAEICQTIRKSSGKLLNKLLIFDVYRGEGIASGSKSIALGLTWQAMDKTLSDDEINALMIDVLRALKDKFNALLRE